jgi:uncharacterized protein YndB with AHSA1/START domain
MSTRDIGSRESPSTGGTGLAGAGGEAVIEAIRKTVLVDFTPEEAFDLFTARIASWWPVRTHSYGGDDVKDVVVEPFAGGRVYEVTDAGQQDWAKVLAWEPPDLLLLDWQIGEACGTEVAVTFEREGPGSRVVLEHRGFGGSAPRDRYSGGWDVVLGTFAENVKKV